MDSVKIAFGETQTWTPLRPLGDPISTDAQMNDLLTAAKGGKFTKEYFDKFNAIGNVYKRIIDQGENAWNKESDQNKLDVYSVSWEDNSERKYYIKVAVEGLQINEKGVVPDGNNRVVKGNSYQRIGLLTHSIGYTEINGNSESCDITYRKSFRDIVVVITEEPQTEQILNMINSGTEVIITAITDGIKALSEASHPAVRRGAAVTAQEKAEIELESRGIVAGERTAEDGTIRAGRIFVGLAVVLSLVFADSKPMADYNYHHLRIWNLTKYNLEWTYGIEDTNSNIVKCSEGRLVDGPVVWDQDGTRVTSTVQIPGATNIKRKTPIVTTNAASTIEDAGITTVTTTIKPAPPEPQVHFADIRFMSPQPKLGIKYSLYMRLLHPLTHENKYTPTIYYELPVDGKVYTKLTFDPEKNKERNTADLHGGDPPSTDDRDSHDVTTMFKSTDGQLTVVSAFDFLTPNSSDKEETLGRASPHYYQSILCMTEKGLTVNDLPSWVS